MGGRARERVLDEHSLRPPGPAAALARRARYSGGLPVPRRLAIVPARDEEDAVGAVVEELRASTPSSTWS